jgi:hypothetical protein
MPSRADRLRVAAEWAARVLFLVLLAVALWRAAGASGQLPVDLRPVDEIGATRALAEWTSSAPSEIHVTFDRAPDPVTRDWLAALGRTGTSVRWTTRGSAEMAVSVEPVVAPGEWTRVNVVGDSDRPTLISDGSGVVDTLEKASSASITLPALWGRAEARSGLWQAHDMPPDRPELRRLLVLGNAGWESKFTIAALEEFGWEVDAQLSLRPDARVVQGTAEVAPDTARYAAVIVLDSLSPAVAQRIRSYVISGGGLVVTSSAWNTSQLRDILPGARAAYLAEKPGTGPDTPQTLAATSITAGGGAVTLDSRARAPVVAAGRSAAGRVVMVGYEDTWRWRMAGPPGSDDAHRSWWARLVSSVAYSPYHPREGDMELNDAPIARLTAALGPQASDAGTASAIIRGTSGSVALLALVFLLFLGETASRRLRGSR